MPAYGKVKVDTITYDLSGTATDVSVSNIATKASPTFTGTVTVPTPSAGDDSTKAASTAFVVASFATKASPTFTGTATGVNLTLSGDLTVNGTTTTINTTTLQVEDKNIEIGKVSSPSDTTADGGGWSLLGATTKTFNWVNATDAWTSSEHMNLGDDKKLLLGTGSDLEIFHNATNSHIRNQTGDLIIDSNSSGSVNLRPKIGVEGVVCITDGAVQLYHNGVKKVESSATGCTVTGTLAATAVTGDGSGLTNLPPGGNTVQLVADGAIGAGKPVILTTAGKAKQVGLEWSTRNPTSQEQSIGDSGWTDTKEPSSCYNPVADRVVAIAIRGSASDHIYHNVVTFSDNFTTKTGVNGMATVSSTCNKVSNIVNDSDHNRVVFAVGQDGSTSNYGTVYVGTVTGGSTNTIAWGSPVTFAANNGMDIPFITYGNGKIFILWADTSGGGILKMRVGDVASSGNTITLGNAQIIDSSQVQAGEMRAHWDSTNSRLVVSWSVGSTGKIVVGSVSGTTMTFGTPVQVFTNGYYPRPVVSDDGKVAILYRNDSASNSCYYIVGTLSTTSVTFGSAAASADTTANNNEFGIGFDPFSDRYIMYTQPGSSNSTPFKYATGTLSGTTITWGSLAQLDSRRYTSHRVTNWGTLGVVACTCIDISNSQYLKSFQIQNAQSSSNLTSTNGIGFAPSAINDTATGIINTRGNTISNQSSLTPATRYHVQTDGTLHTNGSGFGGLALSSTKLLIQLGA